MLIAREIPRKTVLHPSFHGGSCETAQTLRARENACAQHLRNNENPSPARAGMRPGEGGINTFLEWDYAVAGAPQCRMVSKSA